MSAKFSNPPWASFPPALVECLGRQARHAEWERHFAIMPMGELAPQWQVVQEQKDQKATVWGLHSVTLHTINSSKIVPPWPGPWPDALPAELATLEDARACFGEPLFHERGVVIFQTNSPQGLDWTVQCMFSASGQLENLTLVRQHDWLPLEQKIATPSTVEQMQSRPNAAPAALCIAGSKAPATGWYEGRLPFDHAKREYFASAGISRVFRNKGEQFPALGVGQASDEALVQWAWITESGLD